MKEIRLGFGAGDAGGVPLAKLMEWISAAEHDGFQSVWLPVIFGMDALTLAALAGRETSRIEVGTAVVPTHSRHPLYMAQQALTTQAALEGRFTLGLGPSHKVVIENVLGLSYAKPARHVREYVRVLRDLFDRGETSFEGETYRVHGQLNVACGKPPPLLIGALGPLMRRVAGELCDGTITWMVGPRTLADAVGPGVRQAAAAAGRPEPRIVAGVPVCLTDDRDGALETAARHLAMYGRLPSYRAVLDAEGIQGPADMVLAGDEKTLEAGVRRYADAGATDFHAFALPHGPQPGATLVRTRAFLGSLASRS